MKPLSEPAGGGLNLTSMLEDDTLQGVPAECIFGRGKGAAVRQMSGEVHAAAQANTCCDVTGGGKPEGKEREF